MAAAQFIVRGKVQGVWFRASTRAQAERLGLCGHARNLADGCVEVIAIGEADAIDALERWLHVGPPLSRVDEVLRLPPPADISGHDASFTTG